MKFLIVEDDYITAQVMNEILLGFGDTEIAENGKIAVQKFEEALKNKNNYDVIFLDIMMPELDGQETLSIIRQNEAEYNILGLDSTKIVMTTALDDYDNILNAFKSQCEGYLVKPVQKDKIVEILSKLNLI